MPKRVLIFKMDIKIRQMAAKQGKWLGKGLAIFSPFSCNYSD
ncbi:hypothetical protein [Psychrobacter sp. FME13]|nr:hypothetical protein [Psychrobacter sp. FME13]